ncbi:unnamed protein product [Cuscuta europaea]|uniref:GAG-pre-integrase domain-containing protein n=1 Tax=Cuscuta europaea TaxID=41803 RepID=A0A9P1E8A6_CUSEU|nr:unnamed protein product [Cuscuta europaea]
MRLVTLISACRSHLPTLNGPSDGSTSPAIIHLRDKAMGALHLRATSSGPLYPISSPSSSPLVFASVLASGPVWHRRLGHCGDSVLQFLKRNNYYVVILHLPMSVWLVD